MHPSAKIPNIAGHCDTVDDYPCVIYAYQYGAHCIGASPGDAGTIFSKPEVTELES